MAVAGNSSRPRAVSKSQSNASQLSSTPPSSSSSPPKASIPKTTLNGASTASVPSRGTNVSEKSLRNDIGRLVESYRRVQALAWPMTVIFEVASAVFRWEFPALTVTLWMTLVSLCLYTSAGQLLAICLLLLTTAATMGYLSYTNQQLVQQANSPEKQQHSHLTSSLEGSQSAAPPLDNRAKLELESHRKKQLLVEYRRLMHDMSAWLGALCGMLEKIEDFVLWRQRWKTAIIYVLLILGSIFIIYLPFRWVAMVTVNCAFAGNKHCYANLIQLRNWLTMKISSARHKTDEASNHVNSVQQKGNHEPHLQKDGPVSLHPLSDNLDSNGNADSDAEKDAVSQASAPPAMIRTSGSDASQSKNSGPQPKKFESGVCYLCGTLFTSVLKRRRYCRYCGRDFCPKCCSRKLPRSALGATAPAAHTEKELVCNLCHIKLTGEDTGLLR